MTIRKRIAVVTIAAIGFLAWSIGRAEAHAHIFIGVGLPPVFAAPYYAPPPVYYAPPPPVYYAPPPGYYAAPPGYVVEPAPGYPPPPVYAAPY